ncbi:hypothetical protein ES703_122809 [subsurface metagenome]
MTFWQTILVSLITALIGGGAIAALVSAVMQKKNEKETRVFNAKLKAYEKFIGHLKDCYTRIEKEEKDLDIAKLDEISSIVLLVGSDEINIKVKKFNTSIAEAYAQLKKEKNEKGALKTLKEKSIPLSDEIEELMRKDLGI